MKKLIILAITLISLTWISFAQDLTREQFLTQYFNTYSANKEIPKSYKYIQLNFKNINPNSEVYKALQKAVYLDALPNMPIAFQMNQTLTQKQSAILFKLNFNTQIPATETNVTKERLDTMLQKYIPKPTSIKPSITVISENTKKQTLQQKIMDDVYNILTTDYINAGSVDQKTLEYGAIKGMVESTDDKYTVYFPPQQADNFMDNLEWEYEWIGTYIDMPSPGKFVIIAPLDGSPAQDIGLQWWDIITHIDDEEITEDMNINTIINKIKGPAGTQVKLNILRWEEVLTKIVTRAKITLKNLENDWTNIPAGTCYLKINMFPEWIAKDFEKQLEIFQQHNCLKYIFDVRNNPGWSLNDVASMLDYFIPTGETSIIIEEKNREKKIVATDTDIPKLTNKKIVVLINWWSASASEIFAGSIRDYCPKAILIGEKTFGKNSVQWIISYKDWSILKYTLAKRLTWKSKTDAIEDGIYPDIKITDNENTQTDEQLDTAKKY